MTSMGTSYQYHCTIACICSMLHSTPAHWVPSTGHSCAPHMQNRKILPAKFFKPVSGSSFAANGARGRPPCFVFGILLTKVNLLSCRFDSLAGTQQTGNFESIHNIRQVACCPLPHLDPLKQGRRNSKPHESTIAIAIGNHN